MVVEARAAVVVLIAVAPVVEGGDEGSRLVATGVVPSVVVMPVGVLRMRGLMRLVADAVVTRGFIAAAVNIIVRGLGNFSSCAAAGG